MKTFPLSTQFPITPTPNAAQDAQAIDKASRSFEGLFAKTLIASMRKTGFGDALSGSDSTYRDLYDQKLAETLSQGRGLGLAQMLRLQLSEGKQVQDAKGSDAGTSSIQFLDATARRSTPATVAAFSGAAGFGKQHDPLAQPAMASGVADALRNRLSRIDLSAPDDAVPFGPTGDGESFVERALQASPKPAGEIAPISNLPKSEHRVAPAAVELKTGNAMTPEAFVREIWPHAQAAAAKMGVCPKAIIAQAALETGWGRRTIRHNDGSQANNLFGIKASRSWNGQVLARTTTEFDSGHTRREQANFRAYDSVAQNFRDYVSLLSDSPRYADAVSAGTDTRGFANALQRAGYATDPQYAAKIVAIAEGPTLRRALAAIPDRQLAGL